MSTDTICSSNKVRPALWDHSFEAIPGLNSPIFRAEFPDHALFYTPGYLAACVPEFADQFSDQLKNPAHDLPEAFTFKQKALEATRDWEKTYLRRQYRPVCLTLYTSQACNLNCNYCFSQGMSLPVEEDLSLDYIRKAARHVAANCKRAGVPFTLVIHGGGEPTMDKRLPQILELVEGIAAREHIDIFRYIATNGVMSENLARWISQHFDQVGLSCDGLASIQNYNRPLTNGKKSSPFVERTAAIIRQSGKPLHIRATVFQDQYLELPAIVRYFCDDLGASEIRIEPVYNLFQDQRESPQMADPESYCLCYLMAKNIADERKVKLNSSGARPGEIHGRHCQIFRNVLHLVPGNAISACFTISGKTEAMNQGLILGESSTGIGADPLSVGRLQDMLSVENEICARCFNRFHCDRGCPESCPSRGISPELTFRCSVNKLLSAALLQEYADKLKLKLSDQYYAATEIDP